MGQFIQPALSEVEGSGGEGHLGLTVTTLPFPSPTLTKGTQCPAGTVPLTVMARLPDGSIGHKTVCRRITTAPQPAPRPSPGNGAPEGPRVVRTSTTTAPTTVVVEQPPAATPWWEEEWISGVPNKWLALGGVGLFLLGQLRSKQ